MTICSRCDKASRRVIRPYWQLDAQLCPACCRHVAGMHDLNHSWPSGHSTVDHYQVVSS